MTIASVAREARHPLFYLVHTHLRTESTHPAFFAPWPGSSRTNPTSVLNTAVRKVDPLFTRQQIIEFLFNLYRIFCLYNAEPATNSRNVCVDNHSAGDSVGIAKHHVGCLASYARELNELLYRARNSPIVLIHERLATGLDVLGFVTEKSGTPDGLLERGESYRRQVFGRRVESKEVFGHQIDPLVGALCRKDSRHKQLQRCFKTQRTVGIGIIGFQGPHHPAGVAFFFESCFF